MGISPIIMKEVFNFSDKNNKKPKEWHSSEQWYSSTLIANLIYQKIRISSSFLAGIRIKIKHKKIVFTVNCTWSRDIISEFVRRQYNINDVVFDVLQKLKRCCVFHSNSMIYVYVYMSFCKSILSITTRKRTVIINLGCFSIPPV